MQNDRLPLVIPSYTFKLITYLINRVKLPFTDEELFNEFCSLVEAMVLNDELKYFNIGPSAIEWKTGQIIPGKYDIPGIHPYSPFNGLNFISCADIYTENENYLVEYKNGKERDDVIAMHYEGRQYHPYTISIYYMCMIQAYNGMFGKVAVNCQPLIKTLLPKLLVYKNSNYTIENDKLIYQAYNQLKETFSEKISLIHLRNTNPIILPPIVAILLNRLPDNCSDPGTIVYEILKIRDEFTTLRNRFNEMQIMVYDNNCSYNELQRIHKTLNIDSKLFVKKFDASYTEGSFVKFFLDELSFVLKMLRKWDEIEPEEIAEKFGKIAPIIIKRASMVSPTILYDYAMKTRKIKGIGRLAEKKLGLKIISC